MITADTYTVLFLLTVYLRAETDKGVNRVNWVLTFTTGKVYISTDAILIR